MPPKGFFANERTFLSWMSMTLMLGAVSIGLLNFGGTFSHIVAIVFGVLTTALMFYSLIQFNKRGDQLQKKDKGLAYEDMVGSLVMVTVVFVAVAVNFGVHFIYNRN
ncbi:vacuolar transporter chaperone [Polyrhizophydium stewartii]|uniref:Vacuolar transporter chaperone n=1 Tax=Polyrhizophydium stewartii TaxID=2732419 RepID=A0ABR4N982_9FUNG